MVEKKLPGKGWEYMVYDKQDRLIATKDALLATTTNNFGVAGWLFTKYDKFGRVVYTGFTANASTRSALQSTIDSNTTNPQNNESRTDSVTFTQNGLGVYYTKTAFPTTVTKLLSVNYYDSYPSYEDARARPAYIIDQNLQKTLPNTTDYPNRTLQGLPTASFVKNIENDNWTKNYTWYDNKGRAIGTYSQNHLGGYTKTETLLDFAGVPQNTYTYHKRLSTDTEIIIKEKFEYDLQNRLVKHWHNVNNAASDELLTFNEYNELGQVKNKKVGGNATTPLQTVDYNYNIRGWMTGINLDATGNVQTNKLFSYKISYQEPLQITNIKPYTTNQLLEVKPKYNGNISEVTWFSGTDSTEPIKKYGYVYDGLNRLTAGFYYKKMGSSYLFTEENNEIPEYDLNGNILKLKRFAYLVGTTPNKIDDLAYTYSGNRLTNLSDAGNSSGYENASTLPILYDANGNMTSMPGKNIQSINYNYLNLPQNIYWDQGSLSYAYRADGIKVNKEHTSIMYGYHSKTTIKNKIDYLDGFQYKIEETTTESDKVIKYPIRLPKGTMPLAMEQEAYTLETPPIEIDPLYPIDPIPIEPLKEPELQFFPTAEGFYDYQKNLYIYQYKDHLGNVRLSYAKNSSGIGVDVQDQNDYYPFGMNHLKTGTAYFGIGKWNNYKYNGKELQETGMTAMDFRHYASDIGRFVVQDGLAEVMPDWTPYRFAFNNPVYFSDPTGLFEDGSFATCPTCPKTSTYQPFIDDPNNEYYYDSETGKVSKIKQIEEVVVGNSKSSNNSNYISWAWYSAYNIARDSNIRINYYYPRNNLIYNNYTNPAEYAFYRYHLQQATRAQLSTQGQAISQILKTKEAQLATAKYYASKGIHPSGRIRGGLGGAKLLRGAGTAVVVVSAGMSIYNVATADDKAQALSREAGGWAGAWGGAKAGAAFGTLVAGPWGTVIGGAVGGALGYWGGSELGEYLYDKSQ